jgi:peptidoglycan/xylan/chitin deacetylase (PgdA/CDA1 family)
MTSDGAVSKLSISTGATGFQTALRLDDVGAASKRYEIYGRTRLGPVRFPGNWLFLKYLPGIKRWGPYRELRASEWEHLLALLERAGSRLTVAITAGWVEWDGRIVPFPKKFPDEAAAIHRGVTAGLLEVANHGYTHCVLARMAFRPRAFSSNRGCHREFLDSIPEAEQREHLARSQGILQDYFATGVVTFVPPGNVLTRVTAAMAVEHGLRFLSCRGAGALGPVPGLTVVDRDRVIDLHDRDIVLGGVDALAHILARRPAGSFRTVQEIGERLA